ncbi:hypothetical protein STENM223S_03808 [Streptomyces tendae]
MLAAGVARARKVKNLKKQRPSDGGRRSARRRCGHGLRHRGQPRGRQGRGLPGRRPGNLVQVPVDVPVNVSGNSINVIGVLNPAFGNVAVNH